MEVIDSMKKIIYRGDSANNFLKIQGKTFFDALPHVDRKNLAKFFFYSDNKEEALEYGQFVSEWNISGLKILDLSQEEGRQIIALLLKEVFLNDCKESILHSQQFINSFMTQKREKKEFSKKIAFQESRMNDIENGIFNNTDKVLGTQNISDFENGKLLRKALKKLGYDGFCFFESSNGRKAFTYGLLKKPILILSSYDKQLEMAKKCQAKYPKIIYESRYENIIDRDYTQKTLVESDEYSCTWYLVASKIPARMKVYYHYQSKTHLVEELNWKGVPII